MSKLLLLSVLNFQMDKLGVKLSFALEFLRDEILLHISLNIRSLDFFIPVGLLSINSFVSFSNGANCSNPTFSILEGTQINVNFLL